jgi:hypothetical protein
MKPALLIAIALLAAVLTADAGMPQLKSRKVTWDAYAVPMGGSNAVVVIYKSTSLGTVWTPFKPTAYTPANRTNVTISVLPGLYRFYGTAQVQPYGESEASNTVTNRVSP